ncbi:MAG: DUF2500 domain-containing protein [Lachnospiraceae bacterium]|nr:DUF2500 domain-containing protein [Lachnospiraceae bacterium]
MISSIVFNILFGCIIFVVLCISIYGVRRSLAEHRADNITNTQRVHAVVVSKRIDYKDYKVLFQLTDEAQMEFVVTSEVYNTLEAGYEGVLAFREEQYIAFSR